MKFLSLLLSSSCSLRLNSEKLFSSSLSPSSRETIINFYSLSSCCCSFLGRSFGANKRQMHIKIFMLLLAVCFDFVLLFFYFRQNWLSAVIIYIRCAFSLGGELASLAGGFVDWCGRCSKFKINLINSPCAGRLSRSISLWVARSRTQCRSSSKKMWNIRV